MLENCREMKSNNYLYSVNMLCVFFRRDEELMWVFHAVYYPLNGTFDFTCGSLELSNKRKRCYKDIS